MPTIKRLVGLEILDSRGRPTVKATCTLEGGIVAQASVPSGASTGNAEALELRDGDMSRYGGLGCRQAVAHINDDLNGALAARTFATQQALDETLKQLDGTSNKSKLGANAILAVSLAFARSHALALGVPLYRHFANMLNTIPQLPRLTINLFSGGKHAGAQIPIQDTLLVPLAAQSVAESLVMVSAIYRAAAELCAQKYGMRLLTADEGGLAPPFPDVETMFEDALTAIERAGFRPGVDVALAIDVAASHFYEQGVYQVEQQLNSSQMIDLVAGWVNCYPIISVEDGLAEDDWDYWPQLGQSLGQKAITLGDDLLCTNPERIQKAIDSQAANALLLKVNQIGTLSEAAKSYRLARSDGWQVVVSARSGETEDDWLADLAVGWAGDYIKIGSITQSERLAKYNRLLEIEAANTTSEELYIRGLYDTKFSG